MYTTGGESVAISLLNRGTALYVHVYSETPLQILPVSFEIFYSTKDIYR